MGIEFKTKAEVVHEKIREEIIAGKIIPGQRLVISDLAKDFGLSEIPVREAIRRLESEGFVQFTPHVGAVVSEINESEFLEIYIIRVELEALATRLATPHISEKDIAALQDLIKQAETAIERNRHERLGPLNKAFHLKIYGAAPYPYLYSLIENLWEKFELSQRVFSFVPQRAIPSWKEHISIVDALIRHDADRAGELVRHQKIRTKNALEQFLMERKPFSEKN